VYTNSSRGVTPLVCVSIAGLEGVANACTCLRAGALDLCDPESPVMSNSNRATRAPAAARLLPANSDALSHPAQIPLLPSLRVLSGTIRSALFFSISAEDVVNDGDQPLNIVVVDTVINKLTVALCCHEPVQP
jgi:hypothetical protein